MSAIKFEYRIYSLAISSVIKTVPSTPPDRKVVMSGFSTVIYGGMNARSRAIADFYFCVFAGAVATLAGCSQMVA